MFSFCKKVIVFCVIIISYGVGFGYVCEVVI